MDIDQTRAQAAPTPAQGWWLIAVLCLLYALSYLDRQIITLMVDPMRKSLGLSEVQIGLLQGFAFAFFYVLAGLPLGMAADRLPRRKVILAGIVLWSVMASACGLAQRYWQLLLARFGVGVGEAALLPAGYSLIASTFPKERLGTAISIFVSGSIIGGGGAYLVGALILTSLPAAGVEVPLLGHLEPWQAAFVLSGLPCLLCAPLILTVREPRLAVARDASPGLALAIAEIRRCPRFYLNHFFGFGLLSLCGFSATTWLPTFLMREHGMSVLAVGAQISAISMGCGLISTIGVGMIADFWYRRGRKSAHVRTVMIILVLQVVALSAAVSVADAGMAMILLAAYFLTIGFHGGAGAALQIAAPEPLRGRISSIYLFLYTLIGAGAGPLLTAMISEHVVADPQRLGLSIALATGIVAPFALFLLWRAARALDRGV